MLFIHYVNAQSCLVLVSVMHLINTLNYWLFVLLPTVWL